MGSLPISRIAGAVGDLAHRGRLRLVGGDGARERRKIGGAMVVDVIGAEHGARELLQQVVLFVGGAVGTDHANGLRTAGQKNLSGILRPPASMASVQVAATNFPSRLISGVVTRSGLAAKS